MFLVLCFFSVHLSESKMAKYHMSFEGQKLCEILYQAIILGHGVKLSLTLSLSLSLSLSSRLFLFYIQT